MIKIAIVSLLILFSTAPCFAAQEIITEYTYNIGDSESQTTARINAVLQANRIAVEKAGVYIESFSEVRNNILTRDEINAIAAGVVQTTLLDKRFIVTGTNLQMYVKVSSVVDTANLVAKMADKAATKNNIVLLAENKRLLDEVDRLKNSKNNKDVEKVQVAQEKLNAVSLSEEALALG